MLTVLVLPTVVNSGCDDVVEVGGGNTANEEHSVVVLDRDKLRVIHARLLVELLGSFCELEPHRFETQVWLARHHAWSCTRGIDDPMLAGLHTLFGAGLMTICKNRPVAPVSS